MMNVNIPQLQRRIIEAEIIFDIYKAGLEKMPNEDIIELISRATKNSAMKAGSGFAKLAPDNKPCLKHFATILDQWSNGNAIDIKDIELNDTCLKFNVTRCGYYEVYKKMGLPDDLCYAISCCRDGAFAGGYHEKLILDRPDTIATGAPKCGFKFTWSD